MTPYGGVGLVLVLVGLLIAMLWVFLPFAVFGIKDLAKILITEQRATNKLLEQIVAQSGKQT